MIWKRTICNSHFDSSARWNYIFFLAGASSIFLDYFFLYVPRVGSPNSIVMNWDLGAPVAILRSIADIISLWGICMKFRNKNTPPKLHAFQNLKLIKMPENSKLSLIMNVVALLPIPQVAVGLKVSTRDSLLRCVILQLPFRAIALAPSSERANKTMGLQMKNPWFGASQNLCFFILTSHALGALHYICYIYKLQMCQYTLYEKEPNIAESLTWDDMLSRCTEKYDFEYGIFSDDISAKIGTRSFVQKYTYSLAWGLKSLSSFGQTFNASSYGMDTLLSFFIIIFGLILFGDLLARMQTGLQCTERNEDRQRRRQRMVEEWMNYHQLPQSLKKQVKQAIQSDWTITRGLNDENMLDSLPWDTRCEIRRHLYLDIVRNMPPFRGMDDELVNAICGYLRTFSSNAGTYVSFEGEPIHQMLFVFSGHLEILKTNNGGQCIMLGPGDLCGKELLDWCSHPTTSTQNLRRATQTIKCTTDVDAFALQVDAAKLLAIQFHRNGKFLQAFQCYAA